jgi:AraC-like DNA-binding protein
VHRRQVIFREVVFAHLAFLDKGLSFHDKPGSFASRAAWRDDQAQVTAERLAEAGRRVEHLMSDGQQRVGMLSAIPQILEEMGIDPAAVLATAGLKAAALAEEENSITMIEKGNLYLACVEATGCRHFGLLVDQRAEVARLGLVGRLMRNAPTFGAAIRDLVTHHHRYIRGSIVYLLMQGDMAFWGYALYQPGTIAIDHMCDGSMASGFNFVRELSGAPPDQILMGHAAPPNIAPYRGYYGITPHYDAEQYALVFHASRLAAPIPGANPDLRRILEQSIARYWATTEPSVVDRVARLLRARLMSGDATLEEIAEQLAMHPRTLNRRLSDEGSSFRQIFNQTRFEFSRQMIVGTRVAITEIGLAMGYADASAFTRAFRRSSGMTPSEWRMKFQQI